MDHAERVVANLQLPQCVADLGVALGLAEDLFTRRVAAERSTTIGSVAAALCVSPAVANEIAESLREKAVLEYQGMDGRDYRVTLTELGLRQTVDRMRLAGHSAAMPVSLADYCAVVELQKVAVVLDRERIRQAYSDLVIEDSLIDQIGPAFGGSGAVFFYGPSGTGKTSLVERMGRFFDDLVLIPRHIAVDGDLITVFDPSVHRPADEQPKGLDPRYVLCERPLLMVGGELSADMMDLRYDAASGLHIAPIQMQANNGILAVDDFGRQLIRPDEILNRWIIPLSRGVDFLRPNSGTKFVVPFETKLIVSTNFEPNQIGDEALLRRLRTKIYVGACSEAAFNWILVRSAKQTGVEVSADAAAHLATVALQNFGELRPYLAVDFCGLAADICRYDSLPGKLDRAMIDRIAKLSFVCETPLATGQRLSPSPDLESSSA